MKVSITIVTPSYNRPGPVLALSWPCPDPVLALSQPTAAVSVPSQHLSTLGFYADRFSTSKPRAVIPLQE